MGIDGCCHSFRKLAETILPAHMERMQAALKEPVRADLFDTSGKGVKTIAHELGCSGDFSGCYVFLKGGKPFYVGISRAVIRRLRFHMKGKTHYDSSLAYCMAAKGVQVAGTRDQRMLDERFREAFDSVKRGLKETSIAFIHIENDLELYLFEAYCAMELNTAEWNTFRTH